MTTQTNSIIDALFDTATAWAVHGLGAAKRGFEASAHWLETRAKIMGELATKLAAEPEAATKEADPAAQSA